MKEEDDEDEKGIGVVRYQCMPSLVTLLQMRNRLHLAYIGKKLMKWTAMATGKELRKIAQELTEAYATFRTDYRNAYILQARCRYFYPNLNSIVLENIPRKASVTVGLTMKSITGVRVFKMAVKESGIEPYEHLGIEKGGHAIQEAKEAWLTLLKRIIYIVELRSCFEQVEMAHKCATKKFNVIAKGMIPRLRLTITYILQEIEEFEREEKFRLKRVKQKCMSSKYVKTTDVCCRCFALYETNPKSKEVICPKCVAETHEANKQMSPIEPDQVPESSEIHTVKEHISAIELDQVSQNGEIQDDKTCLEYLIGSINDFIDKTKLYNTADLMSTGLNEMFRTFYQVKEKLENLANAKCDIQRKSAETSRSKAPVLMKTPSTQSVYMSCESDRSAKVPAASLDMYNFSPESEYKFGVFEKKYKEIVKITRFQNADGSVNEEKKVITIKTERRNPKKIISREEQGERACVSRSGTKSASKIDKNAFEEDRGEPSRSKEGLSINAENCIVCQGHDSRQTKSELELRSRLKGHPRVRSCMSATPSIVTKSRNATTNFAGSSSSLNKTSKMILPEPNPCTLKMKRSCPNISSTNKTPVKSFQCCCLRSSVHDGASIGSGRSSQLEVETCKPVSMSSSTQTSAKGATKRLSDNNLPSNNSKSAKIKCSDNKVKTVSIATDPLCRDVWSSTTDLVIIPSEMQPRKPSPTHSLISKQSTKHADTKKSGTSCTIKIITIASKDCAGVATGDSTGDEAKQAVSKSSVYDAFKRILMPSSRTVTAETKQDTSTQPELKTAGRNYLSRLSNFISSLSIRSSKSCKTGEALLKDAKIPSNDSLATACSSPSWKSVNVGFEPELIATPTSAPSNHSPSFSCSCDFDGDSNTCCAVAQTISRHSGAICSDKDSTSVPPKDSKSDKFKFVSRASSSCYSSKDVTTSTKRSDRYDVRPFKFDRRKRGCNKETQSYCNCCSDSCFQWHRSQYCKPLCSRSFYEDEYCYFR